MSLTPHQQQRASALRARIAELQTELDDLSDKEQALQTRTERFPYEVPLYGEVPESGQWLDHLDQPVNAHQREQFDILRARREALRQLEYSLTDESRACEAELRALDALQPSADGGNA